MYLFKMVTDDMSDFLLRKQVSIMLESLTAIIALITVSWMLKESHVALLPCLSLKEPLKMTISMYYMIYQSDTYMDTGSQS